MNRTYVGSTIYHIYLSLLHILKASNYSTENRGDNLLFLIESTPHIEKLIPNVKRGFFREVYLISERKDHVKDLGKFRYTFLRKATLIPYLEHKHPELLQEKSFIEKSEIYLCDSDSSKSYFLYQFGDKNIHMIEDGARTYLQRHTTPERFFKMLTNTPIGGGFDKEIKTIHAQFPEKLPEKIRAKAIELNIKLEVAKLSVNLREELFSIFLKETPFKLGRTSNALLLTQPISEDGVVDCEVTKINIYKDMITKIPAQMNIVLKTHPRERTNYNNHFKNITVLPGLFPIEILGLKDGFHFEKGYTLFSTALSNMEIVKERYFLGKDYLDKFTSQGTKNLILTMPTSEHCK